MGSNDLSNDLLVVKGASKPLHSSPLKRRTVQLKVNQKFAQAFEERKRKEEISALEKRGLGTDDDESSSETEDEDGEELTKDLDADIRTTLKLIRKKDLSIYDPSITFFQNSEKVESGSDEGQAKKVSKKKVSAPIYYKDLVRQQAIAGNVSGSEEDDDMIKPVQTYKEEQSRIKQDFLDSLKEENCSDDERDELDGRLFTVRKRTDEEQKEEDEDQAVFQSKHSREKEMAPEEFLEHYLTSEGWKDKMETIPHYEDIVKEDDEDAEELKNAEEFEHSYNFRFEEQGSNVIQTYTRQVEDTMRREDDARKRKRAERKERKALERQKKEEELRRLKNLKQAEIEQKLEKVARLMGGSDSTNGLKPEDLEGDFDPVEYDKRMHAVFDEQYYKEDDEMVKPTWDEEEDKELFGGLPVDLEEDTVEMGSEIVDEQNEEEEEEDIQLKKMTIEEMERAKQQYMDELYGLDYEDLIGEMKCRFKYRQVQNNDFGLTVDEIMAADDKDLKQLVSLKRLAPYADTEYSVDRKRLRNLKKSIRKVQEEKKRRKSKQEPSKDTETQIVELSKKKRKRSKLKKEKTNDSEAIEEADDKEAKQMNKEEKQDSTEPVVDNVSKESEKKKRRSKKKKNGEKKSTYASTGLSTSRLESYKLLKQSI
ncbi:hypothetical protein CCR75_002481 [Bremia lactucae]|uniref:Kri1-like C-terminal domain-containing protein n=1 Tax=Bremia lactucae TaxID=4779 RepID=A0A976FJW1_BRELC|nr:hypothetical protein CCR75_002481 [Bremia lactucae]